MRKFATRTARWSVLAVAFGIVPAVANAGAINISDPALRVQASSSLGSAEFLVPVSSLQEFPAGSGSYRFFQLTPIQMTDTNTGNLIATLTQGVIFLDPSPTPARIGLNFTMVSGDATTQIVLRSALMDSLAATPATGEGSAGLTLTDLGQNGASLVGNGPTGGAYLAQYNGLTPIGATFLEGMNALGTSGTMVDSVSRPLAAIPGQVDDMSAQFGFTMTGNDQVSGTSTYRITPEPASLALFALAAAALRRR